MSQETNYNFPATKQLRISMLSAAIDSVIQEDHTYTEVFNALGQVVASQAISFILSEGRKVDEQNMVVELQKFLNLTGMLSKQLLEDKNVQKVIKQYSKENQ